MTWTAAQRLQKRREYDRHFRSDGTASGYPRIVVPADVTVLDRDPSPCFRCGEREGCRHRRAFAW